MLVTMPITARVTKSPNPKRREKSRALRCPAFAVIDVGHNKRDSAKMAGAQEYAQETPCRGRAKAAAAGWEKAELIPDKIDEIMHPLLHTIR
jgi:hypothetical protein